jgi:hypothetical protein
MLISYANMAGKILFTNDDLYLLWIESSKADEIDSAPNPINFVEQLPNHSQTKNAIRFPRYLLLHKDDKKLGVISKTTFGSIKGKTWDFKTELTPFNKYVESYGKKVGDNIDLSEVFMTARYDGSNIEFSQPVGCKAKTFFIPNVAQQTFQTITNVEDQNLQVKGVVFANFFEKIAVRFRDMSADKFKKILQEIRRRGVNRVCGDYVLIPVNDDVYTGIKIHPIEATKTDEMLEYFGCSRRSQSKLDTLINCLNDYTSDDYKDYQGDKYLIQIARLGRHKSTKNQFVPQDFVLSLASKFKVLATHGTEHSTQLMVEVSDESGYRNDFAQILHTELEATKGEGTSVALLAFTEEQVEDVIKAI